MEKPDGNVEINKWAMEINQAHTHPFVSPVYEKKGKDYDLLVMFMIHRYCSTYAWLQPM